MTKSVLRPGEPIPPLKITEPPGAPQPRDPILRRSLELKKKKLDITVPRPPQEDPKK